MRNLILAPLQITGTVYGVALNAAAEVRALGSAFGQAPYKTPPTSPVLYIKPRNTRLPHQGTLLLPPEIPAVEVSPCLAIVFDRYVMRISEADALEPVRGYTLAIDIAEPQTSYHRPPIREKCRDGFLPIGPSLIVSALVPDPEALILSLAIDGETVLDRSLATGVRSIRRLIAEITGFMRFVPGDALLIGDEHPAPLARAGQRLDLSAPGLGILTAHIAAEAVS